jgi:hypothetical protein
VARKERLPRGSKDSSNYKKLRRIHMEKKKCSVEKSKEYIPKDKMLRKCNI